ncbi:hypothetical protein [Bradyrhizobium sp. 6(2017)]|uniref:hypothetical protein n=1 Tax=Bradyrhizobium sp. 6(2017) TaxID=1197460 RepID=UPI0013E0EDC7|nr:hypothetical protein [Bradyrhizobium sp. 6(2017)]QIG95282.1 hypothetical protein G6P99_24655 [Bradyrhizobium sp. 6(2017)]
MKKPDSKSAWDDKADRAIEIARSLPPGPDRHDAMKKAGLMRRMAALVEEIDKQERPIRGKRPRKLKSARSREVAE